jgi:hypothetical protein
MRQQRKVAITTIQITGNAERPVDSSSTVNIYLEFAVRKQLFR